jgi:hypothetical protein
MKFYIFYIEISVKKYLIVRVRVCVCVGLHITFCFGVMEEHYGYFEGYTEQYSSLFIQYTL